jgi:hypothetical protein
VGNEDDTDVSVMRRPWFLGGFLSNIHYSFLEPVMIVSMVEVLDFWLGDLPPKKAFRGLSEFSRCLIFRIDDGLDFAIW